ncbi:MAG: FAD:protein FMN transferase, partial [Oscillospiraceae bacterium]
LANIVRHYKINLSNSRYFNIKEVNFKEFYMKRVLCIVLSTALIMCGCTEKSFSKDIFAMNTFMTLKAYGDNAENAVNLSEAKIKELEKAFSVTNSESDIYKINHADGKAVEVSADTYSIINSSVGMCQKTDGCLDITIYPVLKEWGFTTSEYKVPDKQTIDKLLEKVDYTKIKAENNLISIPDGMEIDLGSVAKGYASQCVYDIMQENEVESAVINLGGNVQTIGTRPDGSAWNVGILNPLNHNLICSLSVKDEAVITSGNYERYFTDENGKNYWHIIDTADGYPADNGFVSVTIIGKDAFLCDALSTALFVMGEDKAYEYYRENEGFEAVFITDNYEIFVTEGISERIEVDENYTYSVIHKQRW